MQQGSSHPILPGLLYRSSAARIAPPVLVPEKADILTPVIIASLGLIGSQWLGFWLNGFSLALVLLWAMDLLLAGAPRRSGSLSGLTQEIGRLLMASLVKFFGLMSLFFWLSVGFAYLVQLNSALMHSRIIIKDQIMWPMLALSLLMVLTSARTLRLVMWRYVNGERLFPLLLALFVPGIMPTIHLGVTIYASYFH